MGVPAEDRLIVISLSVKDMKARIETAEEIRFNRFLSGRA